ncbi:hypothetical protein D3C81_1636720 [compost metagenome]
MCWTIRGSVPVICKPSSRSGARRQMSAPRGNGSRSTTRWIRRRHFSPGSRRARAGVIWMSSSRSSMRRKRTCCSSLRSPCPTPSSTPCSACPMTTSCAMACKTPPAKSPGFTPTAPLNSPPLPCSTKGWKAGSRKAGRVRRAISWCTPKPSSLTSPVMRRRS